MGYSIAIAGCGVAGLTAALLLARQGHRVKLFEQSEEIGPVGAGVLLQPSGQMVLKLLGLLERVVARAERIERLTAMTHRKQNLLDLPYAGVEEGMHAYGLQRGELFSVLHEESVAAGVEIMLGARIVGFSECARGIAVFDDRRVSRGVFDMLLGTDGARSELRRASGLESFVYDYPHGAIWAMGRCAAIRGRLFQVTHGTQKMCGLLPTGEGKCSLFWSLRKSEKEAFFGRGIGAWKKEVCTLAAEAEELVEGLRTFEEVRFTTYLHLHMPRWHTERFLLLGDAGHAMSPHLGQGINLALLDGWAIGQSVSMTPTVREAFEMYTEMRRGHTDFYAAVTGLLSPFFQSRGMVKGWARDLVLPRMVDWPLVGKQMLLTMTGLKRGYFGGRMELGGG